MSSTSYYKSPIGWLKIQGNGKEVTGLDFVSKSSKVISEDAVSKNVVLQLEEYFTGKRLKFDLRLLFQGTSFQRKVWREVQKIKFGKTVSYRDAARGTGKPRAVRAAATAIGRNRVAIIVPCHRVIASNGAIAGYSGGLWRKKWLLQHEKMVLTKNKIRPRSL